MEFKYIYIIDKRDREGSKIYWKDLDGTFKEYGSKIGKEQEYDSRQASHRKDFKTNTGFHILSRMKLKVRSDEYDDVEKHLQNKNRMIPNCEYTRYWISNEDIIEQMEESPYWFEVLDDNRGEEVFQTLLKEANDRSNSKWDWHLPECIGDWVLERPQGPQTMTIHEDYSLTSDKGPRGKRYPSPNYAFDDAYRFELQSKGLMPGGNDIWYADTRKPRIEENLKLQKELGCL